MYHKDKIPLCFLEDGVEAGIVEPEVLEIRVELDAVDAHGAEPVELLFPVRAVGVDGAEGGDARIVVLEVACVGVAGAHLEGARGGAEGYAVIDARAACAQEQVVRGAFAVTEELVMFRELHFRLFGDARMKNVGMAIDEHE